MLTDAGSIPAISTNIETPTVLGWGFFLPDRAGSRVLLGFAAEACGLHRSASRPVPGHIPLSPGHSSLRPRSLELARSPQRPQVSAIQIKELRADESSGWIAALATRVSKRPSRRASRPTVRSIRSGQTVSVRRAWQRRLAPEQAVQDLPRHDLRHRLDRRRHRRSPNRPR